MNKILKDNRGEGYIDICVTVIAVMMLLVLCINIFSVYIAKTQLNTFADDLIREAEITGTVGSQTTARANVLRDRTGINPAISWSRTGNIQLGTEVTVTLRLEKEIGLFGGLTSFPIRLTSKASGKSEVYHK